VRVRLEHSAHLLDPQFDDYLFGGVVNILDVLPP
jgi:hypothetical protein